MSTKVKFSYQDGKKVARDRGPAQAFNLRSPSLLNLPPKAQVTVKLGVTCSHPVHVYQTRGLRERGVFLVDGVWAMQDAGGELELQLVNLSKETIVVEEGETLARCIVLDNSHVVLEE